MDDAQRTAGQLGRALFKKYEFPLNNEEQKYEARITFNAREVQSFDVNFLFDIAGVARTNNVSIDDTRADGTTVEIEQANAAANAAAVEAANKGGPGSQPMIDATGQKFKGGSKGKVSLYLPQAVQITDGAVYANVDLGIMGAGGAKAMAEGASLIPALIDGASGSAASIIDAITRRAPNSTDLARLAVNRAAGFLPGEGFRGAVSSATRVSVNPNTRALFKSVPLREFTFTFKMIPTSKEETEQIKGIIKFFRENLYPEVITMGDINAGYKFPNVFQIDLKYANKKDNLATKILPSYIRSFSATYNASGMGFLEGGDFTEVDITMAFIESGTLHKELIEKGY
jgi:hypothetical protein